MQFVDRQDAGRRLGQRLAEEDLDEPVVLALPRGGVPVGYEVARALGASLDVLVARKVGAPGRPELGLGAIAEGGAEVLDSQRVAALGLRREDLDPTVTAERAELERRVQQYRGDRPLPELSGRAAVLVDDGLATGVTATAGIRALRALRPARIVLAVPVGAPDTVRRLENEAEVVCLSQPAAFRAVGKWYRRFDQTSDDQVCDLLQRARDEHGSAS